MTEVPTTQWTHDVDGGAELGPRLGRARPKWRRVGGVVTHTFTHFPLELVVYIADVPAGASPPPGAALVPPAGPSRRAPPHGLRPGVSPAASVRPHGSPQSA